MHALQAAAGGEGLEGCGRNVHVLQAEEATSSGGGEVHRRLDRKRGDGAAPGAVHGGTQLGEEAALDTEEAEGDEVLLCPLLLEAVVQQQYLAVS